MEKVRTVKFLDSRLNRALVKLLKKAKIAHSIDKIGLISYSVDDVEIVENELLRIIRSSVFPSWAIITCPEGWIAAYKDYMLKRGIPFKEELDGGELWFLIEGKRRSHSWKLVDPGVCPATL
jgi:hypothetical protein